MKVVELFSGIGAQAKALKKVYGKELDITMTSDWDINAIVAYNLIHCGKSSQKYSKLDKNQLLDKLERYTLSKDGKSPTSRKKLSLYNEDFLRVLLNSIDNTKNKISVTDIKGNDLTDDIDLLTYSFPCQDLSTAGAFHGQKLGIKRGANNRSGMLWEVERILLEKKELGGKLPRFLLLENVTNLNSLANKESFDEWKQQLNSLGYVNYVYILNAIDYGIPQTRKRLLMLSVYDGIGLPNKEKILKKLEELRVNNKPSINQMELKHILKIDYTNGQYLSEALSSQANKTPSRKNIWESNKILLNKNGEYASASSTITTKQDRHPNSGNVYFCDGDPTKCDYRFLTPRECFLLMGFSEKDYEKVVSANVKNGDDDFFTTAKLYKLAGNSIVVNVLEKVFSDMKLLDEYINEF